MQMSASAGTITSVTRRSVSASGSEPSATAPTESSRRIRSERPAERNRSQAPPSANAVPRPISNTLTISSGSPMPVFHAGLARAATSASPPTAAVAAGPASSAATNGAAT